MLSFAFIFKITVFISGFANPIAGISDTVKFLHKMKNFKLNKTIQEDKELPESRVKKMLVSWVDIQPHTISEKTRIMLDHFVNHSSKKINGKLADHYFIIFIL